MKIVLKFCELHVPLFLNGTNLQMKLDTNSRVGLSLIYDRSEKELMVYFNGGLAIIPSSNVASMTPEDPTILGGHPTAKPIKQPKVSQPGKPVVAQVSDPTRDVVFSTGPGKVRD